MNGRTEQKVIKCLLFAGLLISIILGGFVIDKGNPGDAAEYEELKDLDKGGDEGLNLNTASKEQLMELYGIGEQYAQSIIETREKMGGFKGIDDLLYADGIGAKKLEKIRPYVKVE